MSTFSIYDDTLSIGEEITVPPIVTSTLVAGTSITTRQIISTDGAGQVSIGYQASTQGISSIAIGKNAGGGDRSISIGESSNEGSSANLISIGYEAGKSNNSGSNVCIGYQAGNQSAKDQTVIIGNYAGYSGVGTNSVCIGQYAGYNSLGSNCVAVGYQSSYNNSGSFSVSLGYRAGYTNQGNNAIAIGSQAGETSQPANSIVLNASGSSLNGLSSGGLYVNPIRSQVGVGANVLSWSSVSSEIYLNTSKTFVIDHPVENDKYLVHACLEGPEAGVYYRGQSEIVNGESVEVTLPEYVKSFSDFTVQITGIYNGIEIINYNAGEVIDGKFTVYGKNGSFYWLVQAMRLPIETEPLKSETEVRGDGPYRYIV